MRASLDCHCDSPLSWRHISDDGLPAIIDVDVLDPNVLLPAMRMIGAVTFFANFAPGAAKRRLRAKKEPRSWPHDRGWQL